MNTVKTQLIINTMKRSKYNELCATGDVHYDQLYLVEDENLDAFGGRVVNVADPQISSDAVTKSYLETYYIKIGTIDNYVDNSKLYSVASNGGNYPLGTRYINGGLSVFEKQTNPTWNITVNKPDTLSPEDVTISWDGSEFGWKFSFNGTYRYGSNKSELADSTRVEDSDYDIIAKRIYPMVDSYVSKNQMYSCLSAIDSSSTLTDVKNALIKLNDILSK